MQRQQLENFKNWFRDYSAGFYGDDEYVNANLKLKEEHTERVCREAVWLCGELGMDTNERLIAETIALFHDVGRFRQFTEYRTYTDPRSVNHCLLAIEVMRQNNVLDGMGGLEEREKKIIETGVEVHGVKKLPDNLDEETLLQAKLIRDADKLDIYRVVIKNYKEYLTCPEGFLLEVEFPDAVGYSPDVLRAVLNDERIDYGQLKTRDDIKLLQLGWIYDVNFTETIRKIKQQRFLEQIIELLPSTEEIAQVSEHILAYVNSRLDGK